MRRGAGRLRVLALEVEDLVQAWYAAATAIFPVDSVEGEMLQAIPTTYNRPKKKRGRPKKVKPQSRRQPDLSPNQRNPVGREFAVG